jgi:hypothetical protein
MYLGCRFLTSFVVSSVHQQKRLLKSSPPFIPFTALQTGAGRLLAKLITGLLERNLMGGLKNTIAWPTVLIVLEQERSDELDGEIRGLL